MKPKPLFSTQDVWKDRLFHLKLYSLKDYTTLPKIDQVHAICFLSADEIVFYKHIEGWVGNPGGGMEEGENVEDTIRRELIEEAQLELIRWATFGYEEIFFPHRNNDQRYSYFLRTVSQVKLIDKKIDDPAGKGVGRIIVPISEAAKRLNWEKKGGCLIKMAREKVDEVGWF